MCMFFFFSGVPKFFECFFREVFFLRKLHKIHPQTLSLIKKTQPPTPAQKGDGGGWVLLSWNVRKYKRRALAVPYRGTRCATVTLASAGRGARPKRKLTAVARESSTIESSSSRRQQPNSERRTRSSTHTVNLPLLPAETANGAYGPQNSG